MPYKNHAVNLAYWKARYKSNRNQALQTEKDRYERDRESICEKRRLRYLDPQVAESNRQSCRQRNRRLKIEVISAYGGKCACCEETFMEFLTIDHIAGGGKKHIRSIGGPGRFYRWLRENDYPLGFRVLCFNCNSSIGFYGYCPHSAHGRFGNRLTVT